MTLQDTRERNEISTYQGFLGRLYEGINKDLTWEYMFGYLCRSIGYLCKNVSTGKYTERDLLRALSWLVALANKMNCNLQDALVEKYPGICPYCLEHACVCFRTGKKPPRYTPAYEVKEKLDTYRGHQRTQRTRPLNFDMAVDMVGSIYPNNEVIWRYAGPWHLFSKLQEETAELHEAIAGHTRRAKPFEVVIQELADVFAWLLALWKIMSREQSLDAEFISYYLEGCPVCRRNPCRCQPYSSRPEGLIDIIALGEIQRNLEEFSRLLPETQSSLEDVIHSLHLAAKTQDETIARLSVSQAADKLENFKDKISAADEAGKKGFSIINNVLTLADKFI